MFIQVQETPNHNVLKFLVAETLPLEKNYFFENIDDAKQQSPLAYILFQIDGVSNVFFNQDFISVGKNDLFDWSLLKPIVLNIISEFLAKNKQVIFIQDVEENAVNNSEDAVDFLDDLKDDDCPEIIAQIKEILIDRVQPSINLDGGDISYVAFKDGVLFVKLQGACSGCPSSQITLKSGIRNMMQYYIPEVIDVIDVEDLKTQQNTNEN